MTRDETEAAALDLSDDEVFFAQLELRAELVAARISVAYWQRRLRELEAQLPPSNPLRSPRGR